jgi:3-methyladenine DNA glycosylase AlkD
MTLNEVMNTLESMGTEQNRKTYARHGVTGKQFGVSFANLYKLQKKIKRDHKLALELWETDNSDARCLATMIADPSVMTERALDAWIESVQNYGLPGLIVQYVAVKSPFARALRERWIKSQKEYVAQAGWMLSGLVAMNDPDLPDEHFERRLEYIEKHIHQERNRVRHAMNSAVIAIGLRNPRLQKLALAAAARIGKVEVDHGDTSCKTPDAATYILKASKRAKAKKAAAR